MHHSRVVGLSVLSLIAFAAIAGAAPVAGGAGGPAIPGEAWGGAGVTGPSGEPSSAFRYVTVYAGRGTTVEKITTDGGIVRQYWSFDSNWTLPAVTLDGEAGGLSADGDTLVLIRPEYSLRARETEFRILDTRRLRTRDRLTLDGRFSLDAISPDGRLMYLVEYADPRDPLDYRVRTYDLARHEFRPGKIVDPAEPGEQMSGQPVARGASPDGRWAYTLYDTTDGEHPPFIHALDTEGATAVCIDLDQLADQRDDLWRMSLEPSPDGSSLAIVDRGRRLATVDTDTFEVSEVPPPSASASGSQEELDPGWLALGAGAVLLAGAAALVRRRRHPSDATDSVTEDDLERLLADGEEKSEKKPEPDRVA